MCCLWLAGDVSIWVDSDMPANLKQMIEGLPEDMPQGGPAARYKRKWEQMLAHPDEWEDMRDVKAAGLSSETSALPDFRKISGARDARNALWIDNSMADTPLFMERLASCADPPQVALI